MSRVSPSSRPTKSEEGPSRVPPLAGCRVAHRKSTRPFVLIVMDDLGGGTGNHVLSWIQRCSRSAWQVRIFTYARRTTRVLPDCPVDTAGELRGLTFYPLNQIRRFLQLRRVIKGTNPDIVHAYFFWPIFFARVLKLLGAIPYLVENREDQGFGWHRHTYFLLRLTRSVPDRVVCVSHAVREVVLAREKLDPRRVVVIHNGIDPTAHPCDRYDNPRQELGLHDRHLVVGMVANFNRAIKGVGYLLDAIPDVVRAVPSARFVLFGRGEEEPALKRKAEQAGIASHLVFAGFRHDIDRFYATMDVSVLTSLSEGLSITLVESMNAGLPVVATAVGGNPELVVDGVTGYLVQAGDPRAFAAKLVTLLENADLRRQMGRAGRARIRTYFRLDTATNQYLGVYNDVLSRDVGGSRGHLSQGVAS